MYCLLSLEQHTMLEARITCGHWFSSKRNSGPRAEMAHWLRKTQKNNNTNRYASHILRQLMPHDSVWHVRFRVRPVRQIANACCIPHVPWSKHGFGFQGDGPGWSSNHWYWFRYPLIIRIPIVGWMTNRTIYHVLTVAHMALTAGLGAGLAGPSAIGRGPDWEIRDGQRWTEMDRDGQRWTPGSEESQSAAVDLVRLACIGRSWSSRVWWCCSDGSIMFNISSTEKFQPGPHSSTLRIIAHGLPGLTVVEQLSSLPS